MFPMSPYLNGGWQLGGLSGFCLLGSREFLTFVRTMLKFANELHSASTIISCIWGRRIVYRIVHQLSATFCHLLRRYEKVLFDN